HEPLRARRRRTDADFDPRGDAAEELSGRRGRRSPASYLDPDADRPAALPARARTRDGVNDSYVKVASGCLGAPKSADEGGSQPDVQAPPPARWDSGPLPMNRPTRIRQASTFVSRFPGRLHIPWRRDVQWSG
ncbi:hypothetical protein QP62_00085, partial [Staphylococcus aureus]